MDSKIGGSEFSNFFEEDQSDDTDDIPNYTCYLCNSTYEKGLFTLYVFLNMFLIHFVPPKNLFRS